MKKIKFLLLSLLIITLLIFVSCSKKTEISESNNSIKEETIKFGLATGYGGLGDKAFNDMEYKGIVLAQKTLG